jgi:hypothetical protein
MRGVVFAAKMETFDDNKKAKAFDGLRGGVFVTPNVEIEGKAGANGNWR